MSNWICVQVTMFRDIKMAVAMKGFTSEFQLNDLSSNKLHHLFICVPFLNCFPVL